MATMFGSRLINADIARIFVLQLGRSILIHGVSKSDFGNNPHSV
jgi:hypothetical protein